MQQDTIVVVQEQTVASFDSVPRTPSRPQTPYQVLRTLPRDATPAQQDSAIQAWFQPGEIHYSQRPDTLHLPGHGIGRNLKEVNLPQYYRESFFSKDSLLHPEINGGRYGVPGDPVPYTVRSDNVITLLLLFCFILAVVAFANSRRFIVRQLKDFFYLPRTEDFIESETSGEVRYQFFFVMQTCLLISITYFFYVTTNVTDSFVLKSPYLLMAIFFGVGMVWLMLKALLYTLVNGIFFSSKKNVQWLKTMLFITAVEGIILFPAVLLQVYFFLPIQKVIYYFIFALIIIKILTFYKCWSIFFRQNAFSLQIFLYFCALEAVPLIALCGIMVGIVNDLKINF
jgi:hypothetical protein